MNFKASFISARALTVGLRISMSSASLIFFFFLLCFVQSLRCLLKYLPHISFCRGWPTVFLVFCYAGFLLHAPWTALVAACLLLQCRFPTFWTGHSVSDICRFRNSRNLGFVWMIVDLIFFLIDFFFFKMHSGTPALTFSCSRRMWRVFLQSLISKIATDSIGLTAFPRIHYSQVIFCVFLALFPPYI